MTLISGTLVTSSTLFSSDTCHSLFMTHQRFDNMLPRHSGGLSLREISIQNKRKPPKCRSPELPRHFASSVIREISILHIQKLPNAEEPETHGTHLSMMRGTHLSTTRGIHLSTTCGIHLSKTHVALISGTFGYIICTISGDTCHSLFMTRH
jgi:hypothetical protein